MVENTLLRFVKKLKPYTILKGLRYMKHYGLKDFIIRLQERMEPEEIPYALWYMQHKASDETLDKQKKHKWIQPPLISIAVPAYHTPKVFLRQLLETLIEQTYFHWELCMVNASPEDQNMVEILEKYSRMDERIRFQNLEKNLGISENTNVAFSMAKGSFIGILDHDDLLSPDALYEIALRIQKEKADFIYTDEDKVTANLREHYQPHLKPDFNLDLLRSNDYICHFLVVKKSLIEKAGGFRKEFDGAQDYDFIFRCSELAEHIVHVPRILYHWRTHQASTADNPNSKLDAYEAGKRAIEGHLTRMHTEGIVSCTKDYGFYDVHYPVKGTPLVTIIIPNKDQKETLTQCLNSIQEKSTYLNYEIIIVENNSEKNETFEYYKQIEKRKNIRILYWEKGFNFSAINNFAAQEAKGEYLLFLNNDIEVITPKWIEKLLGNCQREEVGIVGSKLYYPDHSIQHAGIIIGLGGVAGHAFLNMPGSRRGYFHKASIQMNYSAVSAACMIIKQSLFKQLGGFEEKLAVAFNDVDLCLRTVKAGYLVVYHPHVEMFHYESKSRGKEDNNEKIRRFQGEIEFMRTRWGSLLKKGDPYYNENLTLSKWNYSLRSR